MSFGRRRLAVGGLAAAGALVAGIYCVVTPDRYEARAELLVSPIPEHDTTFAGVALLRGDTKRAAASVARLVRTPEVAEGVRLELGTRESRSEMLDSVSARASSKSGLVAVTGKAQSPARAARVANAFAQELVAQRTVRFRSEILQTITRLRAQLARTGSKKPETAALTRRLAVLRGVAGSRDPTVQVASSALPPGAPSWPRPWRLVPLGALLGGVAGALFLLPPRRPHGDLGARGVLLDRRVAAVTHAERELARRAAALALRERALAEATSEPEPAPEPVGEQVPEPEPEPAPTAPRVVANGSWNLNELQRLVESRGREFPARVDEWSAYLFHLRAHADADGRLPRSFDALVEDAFGDLLPS
jgi:capsular polysaccharide biosynthesis protein